MIALLCFVLNVLVSSFKSKSRLEAENAALRHQVVMWRRMVNRRVRLTNTDRWFLVQLYRWFPSVLKVITGMASKSTSHSRAFASSIWPNAEMRLQVCHAPGRGNTFQIRASRSMANVRFWG